MSCKEAASQEPSCGIARLDKWLGTTYFPNARLSLGTWAAPTRSDGVRRSTQPHAWDWSRTGAEPGDSATDVSRVVVSVAVALLRVSAATSVTLGWCVEVQYCKQYLLGMGCLGLGVRNMGSRYV